jgi:hypothetical protein
MDNDPYWSSLTLHELLEKTQEFADTTYSHSLSTLAFLERVLERLPEGSALGMQTASLLDTASRVNQLAATLRTDLVKLANDIEEAE